MQRCRRDFEQILLLHTIGKTAFFGKQFIQLFQRGFSYIRHSIYFFETSAYSQCFWNLEKRRHALSLAEFR
jgi:hypothetical protein